MGYNKKLYNILGGLQVVIIADSYYKSIRTSHKYYNFQCYILFIFDKYLSFSTLKNFKSNLFLDTFNKHFCHCIIIALYDN